MSPRRVTPDEVANTFAEVLGRCVSMDAVPRETWEQLFRSQGMKNPTPPVKSIAGRIGPIGRAPYAAAKFFVEGFSESRYKEVGPLGIKVTIVEPGGFRTDFAGISTDLRDATVGATVRFQRDYDGKQPGDLRRQPRRFCRLRR